MDDQNAFGHLIPGQSSAPGPIMGPPPSDIQQNADARAGNADARSARDQQLQEEEAARKRLEFAATHNRDGSLKPDAGKPTESQSKDAGFYSRMIQAERDFGGVPEGEREPRGIVRDTIHSTFPRAENVFLNSPDRQKADQAAENFIAASLRHESGAAIGKDEYDRQYRIFYPQPGDSEEVIKQKAAARQNAINGMKVSAGPLADQAQAGMTPTAPANTDKAPPAIAPAIAPGSGPDGAPPGGGNPPGGLVNPDMRGGLPIGTDIKFGGQDSGPFDRERYLKEHYGMTPDQETQATAFWNQNAGNASLTPENVTAWYKQQGIPAPVGDDLARAIADAKAGKQVGGIDTSAAEKAYRDRLQMNLDKQGFDPNSAAGYKDRFMQGATLGLSDEVGGVGAGIGAALQGKNPADAYLVNRDALRMATEQERNKQGLAGHVAEFAGGLVPAVLTGGGEGVAGAVKSGATLGAAAGYGYGNGLQGSVMGAAQGGLLGATLGAGGAKVSGMIASRAAAGAGAELTPEQAAMQAADRQNITMMPADVGGRGTRMASGVVGRTLGEIPMQEGAQTALATAKAARDRIAGDIGRVADETGAGQAAQRGAQDFIGQSRTRGDQLYDAITVPNDKEAVTTSTTAALADAIKGFTSNPKLSKIWTGNAKLRQTLEALTPVDVAAEGRRELATTTEALKAAKGEYEAVSGYVGPDAERLVKPAQQKLQAAQDAFAAAAEKANRPPEGGKLSWEDMKRLRSIVGEIVGQPGLAADGNAVAKMRSLYGALSSDMEATAKQAGGRALTEFNRATQYWRGRDDRISNVLTGILGSDMKQGGLAAYEQINRWAQAKGGDPMALARAMRSMPEEEANTVRATVFGQMGKAAPGRQDAEANVFSPAEFVTQWNKLSPRAKSVLIQDGGHRAALNDIATAFDAMKRAPEYANVSKTSLGTNAAAHAAGVLTHPIATVMTMAAEFGAGKLLASPKFARWLARVPEVRESAMPSYIGKLANIAAENGAIAADARGLQQALMEAFGKSPVRAAAAPSGQQEGN